MPCHSDSTPAPAELVEKWKADGDAWYGDDFNRGRQAAAHQCSDELAASLAAHGRVEVDEAAALSEFTEYFVLNYPGPHTIIGDPHWHAPKIFRAAKRAITAALGEKTP